MPGEAAAVAASVNWTGAEGLYLGVIGLVAVVSALAVIVHLRDCKTSNERVHSRISEVKNDVAELKVNVARIEERTKKEA